MATIDDFRNFVLFTIASLLCLPPVCSAQSSEAKDSIIAKEKAALDRWKTGDTYGFIDLAADEITYFDPGLEKRCTGIKEFRDHLSSANGTFSFPGYELLNPQVQFHGNIGVLTFNFVGHLSDGKEDRWNATEVYCLIDNDWRIVSSHWSRTKP